MLRILGTNSFKADRVAEADSDACRPLLELGARPLKAMIAVAEAAFGERGEDCVVIGVGGGEDYVGGPGELEQVALESGKARGVQMLNDFNDGGCVEALKTSVAIDE